MFWKRKKQNINPLAILTCPSCKRELEIPSQVIKDFSPGGKEFHQGGTSSIICPFCSSLIELK